MVIILIGAAALAINGLWVYAMFDRAGQTCQHQTFNPTMVVKK